jgi:Tol biopolymer transport system component
MLRNMIVFALLLIGLLCGDVLGQQRAGHLVYCKKRRHDMGTYLSNSEGRDLKRIMFLCGAEVAPRLSPDGTTILFSFVKGGRTAVWTVNRDGENRKEICPGDQAAWSPDGTAIFFRRNGQIVQRLLASAEETIVSPPTWRSCAFPDCSADGKSIVFVAEEGNRARLVVSTLREQRARVLAVLSAVSPARWSPTGDRIAYSDGLHIWIMAADGSWRYRLTPGSGIERSPAWSPDGTMLAYCYAPTVNTGSGLCFARVDGTQARALPREDDVADVFAPDWRAARLKSPGPKSEAKPAATAPVVPRVQVWDTGGSLFPAAEKWAEYLKKREGWQRVAGAPSLRGGVVLENQRLQVLLGSGSGSVFLVSPSAAKQPTVIELTPFSATGEEARRSESLRVTESRGEEAMVELSSSTAMGEKVRTTWRLWESCPSVQITPGNRTAGVRIRVAMKFAVIPDRFADDLVYDPASYSGTRIALPAAPLVLGFLGSGDGLLALSTSADGPTVDLVSDARRGASFAAAEIRLNRKPLNIGLLAGPKLWHVSRPNVKYERKRLDLNWDIPGPASWRLAVRAAGRVHSTMFTEKETGRLDGGKRLILTDQEEFNGLIDLALVYLYGRSIATPLEQWTPLDLALDNLGLHSFARALDIEGLQSYRTAPRPTTWADIFDTLHSIRVLYDRDVEIKETIFVEHLCDDVPSFLEGMDGRLDAFVAFTHQVAELAKGWEKGTPQARAFHGEIKPTLDKLQEVCQRRGKLSSTAEAVHCAVQIKELTARDIRDRSAKKKQFSAHQGKLAQAAQVRADLIKAFRASVRELRDRAGMACAEHSEIRNPAERVRQLAQDVLRNRYYFEADWRGEPHRIAPFWLGPRP